MKIEVEPKDMESFAHRLMDLLKPLISSTQREEDQRIEETGQNRVLMDVEGVAKYLGVKVSWVYDKTRKKKSLMQRSANICDLESPPSITGWSRRELRGVSCPHMLYLFT